MSARLKPEFSIDIYAKSLRKKIGRHGTLPILLLWQVSTVSILWFGAKKVGAGSIRIGAVMAAAGYAALILSAFMTLGRIWPKTDKVNLKNFKNTMEKLYEYISAYKISIITAAALAITGSIFTGLALSGQGGMIEELIAGAKTGVVNSPRLRGALYHVLCLQIIGFLCFFAQWWITSGAAKNLHGRMRRGIDKKLGPSKIEGAGDMAEEVDAVAVSFKHVTARLAASVCLAAVVIIMLFTVNWVIALIAIVLLAALICLTPKITRPAMTLIESIGYIAVIIASSLMSLSVQNIYTIILYMYIFNRSADSIVRIRNILQSLAVPCEQIFEIIGKKG